MSKVKPRGEISPFTAAMVAFAMVAASGLSLWHFVIRDTVAPSAIHSSQRGSAEMQVAPTSKSAPIMPVANVHSGKSGAK